MHTEGKISVEDGHSPCMRELKGLSFGVPVVVSASDIPLELFRKRTADMRRLAACWNACEGVATQHLENNHPIRWLVDEYNNVIKQRDKALAKLDRAQAEIRALEDNLREVTK